LFLGRRKGGGWLHQSPAGRTDVPTRTVIENKNAPENGYIMNLKTILKLVSIAAILPAAASAQNTIIAPPSQEVFGGRMGQFELGIGANGVSNKDLDDSAGGGSASLGYYLNDFTAVVVRQSVNYSNPGTNGTSWNGSTRVGFDQHFTSPWAKVRPFIGASAGRIYGDSVDETWTGGLDAGAKFYVLPQTFIFAVAEYQWYFEKAERADNSFNDGQFIWSAGMGFNF
jgi:hypothetical protein